ncbi:MULTISPECIES: helix-turn-helix domain-containing protein [Gammaproteobacteria]|uniref:helix-turn-helix domain-containing protein n=1 Tax=Gammaproteobacteria TaxID=1236 RepID=UPI000DD045B4|nr:MULTISPECIES: helix-turn-helix transcriptional regulator [Gammaproteobacteria]RTE85861.1 XRE family transcriptional regulator [Aliidiomarina sp. B3213]TCZ90139.1 XRE family transcriptional regulator [Lysobacter sp. N42]
MEINAKLIKEYRNQKCWSQLQLAEMAGISMRTLQRLEKTSTASLETIKSIAAVLEVEASELTVSTTEQEKPAIAAYKDKKRQRRNLFVGLVLVCVINIMTFALLFYRHMQGDISDTTFIILKNLISISVIVVVLVAGIQGWRKGLISKKDFY